jgi:hypothetical protein
LPVVPAASPVRDLLHAVRAVVGEVVTVPGTVRSSDRCSVSAVTRLVDEARDVLASMEPERFDAADAVRLVELFGQGTKLMESGLALAARRVAACGAHRAGGHLSPAQRLPHRHPA